MKILIFGASGYIGRHLVDYLHRNTDAVLSTPTRKGGGPDLLNISDLTNYFTKRNFDLIINATGSLPHKYFYEMSLDINLFGSANIVSALASSGKLIPLIHLSSATEFLKNGKTESEYSDSKLAGFHNLMKISENYRIPVIRIILHNVIGSDERSGSFPQLVMKSAKNGHPIEIKHPKRVRDFVWIDDCLAALTSVIRKVNLNNELGLLPQFSEFTIGTGRGVSLMEFANLVYSYVGADPELIKCRYDYFDDFEFNVASEADISTILCLTPIGKIISNYYEGLIS